MKRRNILVAVMCMLSMLAFAGCGKKTEDVAEVEETETVVEEEPEVVEEEPVQEIESNRIESFDDTMIENILHIETAYAEFLQDDSLDAKDARKNDEAQHTLLNENIKVVKAILYGKPLDKYPSEKDISYVFLYVKGTTEDGKECYRAVGENPNDLLNEGLDALSVGYDICTVRYSYDTIEEAIKYSVGDEESRKEQDTEILDERDFE